jgi:hypothetical protein
MVDMLALLFWTLFIRLDEVNSKRFCKEPMLLRSALMADWASSKLSRSMVEMPNPLEVAFSQH